MGQEVKAKAEKNAEEKILDVLVSKTSSESTRESFRQKLRSGDLNEKEVEIPFAANSTMNLPTMDIPGMCSEVKCRLSDPVRKDQKWFQNLQKK